MHDMLLKLAVMAQPDPEGLRNTRPSWDFPGAPIVQWFLGIGLALIFVVSVFVFFGGLLKALGGVGKGKEGVGAGLGMALGALIVGGLALAGTNTFIDISNTIPNF